MAYGSCGKEFRDSFSCFHYSKEDPKGSDCVDSFVKMHNCFQEYPEEYGKFADDEDDMEESNKDEDGGHSEGKTDDVEEGKTKETRDEERSGTSVIPSLSQPINSAAAS